MECILLSSKPKVNPVEKEKQQECNNDNNQRLVQVFVDAIEIHATQTEPSLHWVGSCFSIMCKEISFQHGRAKT